MSLKIVEKRGYVKLTIPRSARDVVHFKSITDDGIADLSNGLYSKSYEIKDIDYFSLDDEDRKRIFFPYSDILNSLGGTKATYKLTLFKRNRDRKQMAARKLLAMMNDGYDDLRLAYNDLRRNDIETNEKELCKYITVTAAKKDINKARSFFNRLTPDFDRRFAKIQSGIRELDADARLKLVFDFFNSGHEDMYVPYAELKDQCNDIRASVCPDGILFHNDYFEVNGKFGRVMMLRTWSRNIKDDFLNELVEPDAVMMATLDIIPLTSDDINKLLDDKDSDVEASVINWSNTKNARTNRAAVLPRRMKKGRKILDEYTEDINERNQRIFLCQMTIAILADTMEKLDEYTESVLDTASEFTCNIGTMWFMQYEGLANTIPFGIRPVMNLRDCNTETAAMLIPFNAKKVQHDTGIPYGMQISTHEQVFIDRRLLKNGNEIVLGDSGSGKSVNTKLKSIYEALTTNGYIIFIDPDGEYKEVAAPLGGNIIKIGTDSLNVFDMTEGYGYGLEDPVKAKSNFIISLFERIFNDEEFYDEIKKSITDRCVRMVCEAMQYYPKGTLTLLDFYNFVKEQPEAEAAKLALSLERHITGSFNVFAKPTSVAINSRIICFDLSTLDRQLKNAGMMVCLDYVDNILARNRHEGVATYIRLDELDEYLRHPASRAQVETFFQRARKYGGFCTGLIQNIDKIMNVPEARTMIKNSENIIMMGQSEDDAGILADMYGLSTQDVDFLITCEPGLGINKIGSNMFRFDGRIPENNLLYKLVNTDGHRMTE